MRNKRIAISVLTICVLALVGCGTATKSKFDIATDIETEFIVLAEQYAMWKSTAPAEVKAEWIKNIDPLFIRADLLLDEYKRLVLIDGETGDITKELMGLKTQILMELAQRYGEAK